MIVVGDIATHRKDDLSTIERHLRVANHTVHRLKQRLYPPLSRTRCRTIAPSPQPHNLKRTGPLEFLRIDLIRLKESRRIMMVLFVLIPHHKNDRVIADKRIGKERPPLQTDKTLINLISRPSPPSLRRCKVPLDHRKLR